MTKQFTFRFQEKDLRKRQLAAAVFFPLLMHSCKLEWRSLQTKRPVLFHLKLCLALLFLEQL